MLCINPSSSLVRVNIHSTLPAQLDGTSLLLLVVRGWHIVLLVDNINNAWCVFGAVVVTQTTKRGVNQDRVIE